MNLRHLAKVADLSPSAVSLALRDSPKISAATKKRVRRLAEKMGYRADARVVAMMSHLRKPRAVRQAACFGVISFYPQEFAWDSSPHLRRIFSGMKERADALGYRLEPVWLRAPGMTFRRAREILDTRGIEGLLCFGSPDLEEEFPRELGHYAVVTIGVSIRTPLHRITSRFYFDMMTALNRVHALGYRRPGLVIGTVEEARSAHMHSAAYLSWCERLLGASKALPILRVTTVEKKPLAEWLEKNSPDVVVFVHLPEAIPQLRAALREQRRRVPAELGVAVLSHLVEGTGFSGLQQNQQLMGAWAVEMLAARIANRDLGLPAHPRTEMVESEWIDGGSLPTLRRGQTA
ncbi:MAG: LacI family DNA-binding transcriptional regulator [Verrucomicrobia bacterium]|nr:LacI family DNA-binding transcriptional regulator [Verrucomicrobiota bacterium]